MVLSIQIDRPSYFMDQVKLVVEEKELVYNDRLVLSILKPNTFKIIMHAMYAKSI